MPVTRRPARCLIAGRFCPATGRFSTCRQPPHRPNCTTSDDSPEGLKAVRDLVCCSLPPELMPSMTNDSLVDQPRTMREEDRFDVEAVDAWLKARVEGLEGQPEVRQFSKGVSNLTYLLRYANRDL